jgi:hypothetical protein
MALVGRATASFGSKLQNLACTGWPSPIQRRVDMSRFIRNSGIDGIMLLILVILLTGIALRTVA